MFIFFLHFNIPPLLHTAVNPPPRRRPRTFHDATHPFVCRAFILIHVPVLAFTFWCCFELLYNLFFICFQLQTLLGFKYLWVDWGHCAAFVRHGARTPGEEPSGFGFGFALLKFSKGKKRKEKKGPFFCLHPNKEKRDCVGKSQISVYVPKKDSKPCDSRTMLFAPLAI